MGRTKYNQLKKQVVMLHGIIFALLSVDEETFTPMVMEGYLAFKNDLTVSVAKFKENLKEK